MCPDGEECVDGECVPVADPCDGVTCPDGEECVDGECLPVADPCDGVTCPDGEECIDGECVPEQAAGDPVAGEAYYAASCLSCHGENATGGIGPNIQGFTAAALQAGVEGAGIHAAITITDQDYADLEAYLAGL